MTTARNIIKKRMKKHGNTLLGVGVYSAVIDQGSKQNNERMHFNIFTNQHGTQEIINSANNKSASTDNDNTFPQMPGEHKNHCHWPPDKKWAKRRDK